MKKLAFLKASFFGVPDWIRTNGTKRRRLVLYPAELRIRVHLKAFLFYYFSTAHASVSAKDFNFY